MAATLQRFLQNYTTEHVVIYFLCQKNITQPVVFYWFLRKLEDLFVFGTRIAYKR